MKRWENVEDYFLKLKRNQILNINDIKQYLNLNRHIFVYKYCNCGWIFREKKKNRQPKLIVSWIFVEDQKHLTILIIY